MPEPGPDRPEGERAMYGTMYGMTVKTTVYLPDDLKRALEVEAAASGRSEAEIIREAIAAVSARNSPQDVSRSFVGTGFRMRVTIGGRASILGGFLLFRGVLTTFGFLAPVSFRHSR